MKAYRKQSRMKFGDVYFYKRYNAYTLIRIIQPFFGKIKEKFIVFNIFMDNL